MHKVLVTLILTLIMLDIADARPRSLGATFSYAGWGLAYEHSVKDGGMLEICLRSELSDRFRDMDKAAGMSASFTYGITLTEWISSKGMPLKLNAGPGAYLAWTEDFRQGIGAAFGLKGRICMECCFERNVILTFGAAPVVGVHLRIMEDHVSMKLFRNGLLFSIMPEIGVRYRF